MADFIQEQINRYITWLREEVLVRPLSNDWVEITTPNLDRHNDYLQIYAKREGNHIRLSDDGYIINDLEMSGCKLATERRAELLKQTLRGFGVEYSQENHSLNALATTEDFPTRLHSLIQAMLSVDNLFYTADVHVESLFFEDVLHWLRRNGIEVEERQHIVGKSGMDLLFDFVIPTSERSAKRVLQTMTRRDLTSAKNLVFNWVDARESLPPHSAAFAILDDRERPLPPHSNSVQILEAYDIRSFTWTEKDRLLPLLAA